MTLSKDNWDKLFPLSVNMQQFEDAYSLTSAAGEICRIANAPVAGLAPDQIAQRKTILNLALGVVLSERDKALDAFCKAWLAHRA